MGVEKCEKSQMMWGGPPRDPFTGQIYTQTVRPVFDSALKSRIDRFLLDHGSQVGELRHVGRTLGSADKISQFLEDKSRGIKRGYNGEMRKVPQSDYSTAKVQTVSQNSRTCSSTIDSNSDVISAVSRRFDSKGSTIGVTNAVRHLPQIIKSTNKMTVEIKR